MPPSRLLRPLRLLRPPPSLIRFSSCSSSSARPSHIDRLSPVADDPSLELRWMHEEIARRLSLPLHPSTPPSTPTTASLPPSQPQIDPEELLEEMVRERARGKPLQYVLKYHPFGDLLLELEEPILIPRPETEEWVLRLSKLLHAHLSQPSPPPMKLASVPTSATDVGKGVEEPREQQRPFRMLDLCTGTGCIPLLLLSRLPNQSQSSPQRSSTSGGNRGHRPVQSTAIDLLPSAVFLALRNAVRCSIPNSTFNPTSSSTFATPTPPSSGPSPSPPTAASSNPSTPSLLPSLPPVFFSAHQADIFSSSLLPCLLSFSHSPTSAASILEAKSEHGFDLLTSNPPYIPTAEMLELDESVLGFEDGRALRGDVPHLCPIEVYPPNLHHLHNRGLDFYIRISHLLAQNLLRRPSSPSPLPQIVLECGHDQAPSVEQILMEGPSGGVVERVETWVDFGGHGRVVVGWLKPKEEERGGEPEPEAET